MSLPDPVVLHVVVGPDQHGVVRHGGDVARACGDRLLRLEAPRALSAHEIADADIVHVPFTDRLFAPRCEQAVDAFERLVAPAAGRGASISMTLHDLPAGDDVLAQRRRAAYQQLAECSQGIVVSSARELELVGGLQESARSLRMVPLPVDPVPRPEVLPPARWAGARDAVVLGFVFPDRGYEAVVGALPDELGLLALGRAAVGHEDLPEVLAGRAAELGRTMRTSGFVDDADLAAELWAAGVPIAPNPRVAASGSIGTWVAHGRRPLVPDTTYTRELAGRWPGALTRYDGDDPQALAAALRHATNDPASTWLDPAVVVGPSLTAVAALYRRHFLGCAPERAYALGGGRVVVPGNRWDLVPVPETAGDVEVSVVVPWYRDQADLDLVLTALALQDHRRLEVVVADDGSPRPPSLEAAGDLPVTLVRQERDGFRAAAARNLGARAASGEVLLFLDGDTIPEPGYVSAMLRLPAACPDAVVVGRRRHADLDGWTPAEVVAWLTDVADARTPTELDEPAWLADAYRASLDLRHADERSYRFVISAVLGLDRDLFAEVGGFDERFRAYGGEDWELAHRLFVAGAVLAHVPGAVAWHDGPDWAARAEQAGRSTAKNAEALALSRLLPDPVARGGGTWARPAVALELTFGEPAAVLATARTAFAGETDVGVWLVGPTDEARATADLLVDPRIHAGPVPDEMLDRASTLGRATRPVRLLDLRERVGAALRFGPAVSDALTVVPTRARRRSRRWAGALGVDPVELELRLFGGRDVVGPPVSDSAGEVDLAHELTLVHRAGRR